MLFYKSIHISICLVIATLNTFVRGTSLQLMKGHKQYNPRLAQYALTQL